MGKGEWWATFSSLTTQGSSRDSKDLVFENEVNLKCSPV